jgi:hypothetical protein
MMGLVAPVSASSQAVEPTPSNRRAVAGPIEGGQHGFPFLASVTPLASLGYSEKEYFFSGQATSYTASQPLATNGRWEVRPADKMPYTSRLLVRRPADPAKFNGTVIVEWLNVSYGHDISVSWSHSIDHLLSEGYAYVGVSAQEAGVEGFPVDNPARNNGALKLWDPVRYAPLDHPGDSFSYDIFTQAARAIRGDDGVRPLGELDVKHLVATGASQSALRLNTYINAVQPLKNAYDGFIVQVGFGLGAPLSQAPQPAVSVPSPLFLRTDLRVPVLVIDSETEVLGWAPLGDSYHARQPDTDLLRRWEIAGGAHGSAQGNLVSVADVTHADPALPGADLSAFLGCAKPINRGPSTYLYNAGIEAMRRWLGPHPIAPTSALLDVIPGTTLTVAKDAVGNALGGVRSTLLDVPTAVYSGANEPSGSGSCNSIAGSTVPLDDAALRSLYPTHQDYVEKVAADARKLVDEGFLVPADATQLTLEAMRSGIGLPAGRP